MFGELAQMMHNMFMDSPVPPREIAAAVGKPYSTLLREVNLYDSGAKLGVETMFKIIQHTGNMKPLEYMAEQLGFRLIPMDGDVDNVRTGYGYQLAPGVDKPLSSPAFGESGNAGGQDLSDFNYT